MTKETEENPHNPLHEPVLPERVRTLPKHFAWVDHRLRLELRALSLEEMALLFFLHLAADKLGCSYWSDASIAKRLGLETGAVSEARLGLVRKGLVAYRWPLYQILPLPEEAR